MTRKQAVLIHNMELIFYRNFKLRSLDAEGTLPLSICHVN